MGMRAHLLPSARALARGWRSTATSGDNLVLSAENGSGEARPICRGPVVGQSFGLFDGVYRERYERIVAAAPFDKCNLLILAFVGSL